MMHACARTSIIAAALALAASGAFAAEENREQGAHQHGHGTFEMAIEKGTVSIELRVPGSDIVGFEHAPKTDKEKSAIKSANTKLGAALALFGIPKAAECKVKDTDIHLHGAGEDGDAHDHKPDASKPAEKAEAHDHADGHATFHVKYTLACAKPAALTALDFNFFKIFPASQELEVVAISEKGQVKAEATPKSPTVSLAKLW